MRAVYGDQRIQSEQSVAAPRDQSGRARLADRLKARVEALAGYSLDSVNVHFNSPKPAQLNVLAYAQGDNIHLAPGQERHLPQEAWHVVQQSQDRVRPTMQLADGVYLNDDASLEHEAEVMGAKAAKGTAHEQVAPSGRQPSQGPDLIPAAIGIDVLLFHVRHGPACPGHS